ncbi:MAG: hypothetical protein PHR66_11215 [Desulfuromonadaceae bacterium]|nr:hypothetical protein [Desulfuromonadaceae bacterium]
MLKQDKKGLLHAKFFVADAVAARFRIVDRLYGDDARDLIMTDRSISADLE